MKRIPFLFVLIMLVFTILISLSCKKDRTDDNILAGKWELRKEVGGFAGTLTYPAGNGHINQYNEDLTVKFYQNFVPVDSGTYRYWWSPADNLYKLEVTTHNYTYTQKFSIENNQLIFAPQEACCDIPAVFYERIP